MPLNCTFKVVQIINFILCIYFHNKKINELIFTTHTHTNITGGDVRHTDQHSCCSCDHVICDHVIFDHCNGKEVDAKVSKETSNRN